MKFLEEKRVQEGIIIRKHHYVYEEGWISSKELNKNNCKKVDKSFVQLTKDMEITSCGKSYFLEKGSYVDRYLGTPVSYKKDRKVEVCFAGGKIIGSREELKNTLMKIMKGLEE